MHYEQIETNSEHDTPLIENHIAIRLFYIGLIIQVANILYFYIPIASFLVLSLPFLLRKHLSIGNSKLKWIPMILAMPLITNLLLLTFKKLLIFAFCGISSLNDDITIKPLGKLYESLYPLLPSLLLLSIGIISACMLILIFEYRIWKKFFRIVVSPVLLISCLGCGLFGFFCCAITMFEVSSQFDGKYNPRELIIDKPVDDYHVRAYRTDYQGALGAFGVEIQQVKKLPFGLQLIRDITSYYHCANVQMELLNKQSIRVKPEIKTEKGEIKNSSAQIFALKPFQTTKILKFFADKN